jgi:hypothetical protein
MTASLPEPEQLRGSLGREEFTQRLLTCLVLGRLEGGWNITRRPSSAGALFLRDLHASAFGDDSAPEEVPGFVDEFELPRRTETEPSGWPDYGVVWPDRLFLVELKTARTSHRTAQIPYYLELAAHWHRDDNVDLLYLTPSMPLVAPTVMSPLQRFRHLTWAEVAPLVEATWSHADVPAEREMASYLVDLIDEIETTGPAPPAPATTPTVEPGAPAASLPPAPAATWTGPSSSRPRPRRTACSVRWRATPATRPSWTRCASRCGSACWADRPSVASRYGTCCPGSGGRRPRGDARSPGQGGTRATSCACRATSAT